MTTIIAYTYDADVHCPSCAKADFANRSDRADENGIPFDAVDSEGNVIHPIFSTDEVLHDIHCRQCLSEIAEGPETQP